MEGSWARQSFEGEEERDDAGIEMKSAEQETEGTEDAKDTQDAQRTQKTRGGRAGGRGW